jgi:hypothetical protein
VGKENEVRLSESLMNLEERISYQQGVLIEEEDQRCVLIIGGMKIFLPSMPLNAITHFEGASKERHPTEIVMEDIDQTLKYSQEME